MKIGVLQTGYVPETLSEEFGEYPQMFSELLSGNGFVYETYPVVENQFPISTDECDGWIVTGSRHGAYEDHEWIPPLEDFIRAVYAKGVPIVGICFGHQIMAQALGGKVEKFGGLWGVGKQVYAHPDGSSSTLLAMHQDQVVELPPDASVMATSDFCKYAGLSYKGKAMSLQPHPEFTPEFMDALIRARAGTAIPNDQALPALEDVFGVNDAIGFAKMIAGFFKASRAEKAA